MPSDSITAFWGRAKLDGLPCAAVADDPTLPQAGVAQLQFALRERGLWNPALAEVVEGVIDLESAPPPAAPAPPAEFAPESLSGTALAAPPRPATAPSAPVDRGRLYLLIGVAVGLQVLAVFLWVVFILKPFSSGPPAPAPASGKVRGVRAGS